MSPLIPALRIISSRCWYPEYPRGDVSHEPCPVFAQPISETSAKLSMNIILYPLSTVKKRDWANYVFPIHRIG